MGPKKLLVVVNKMDKAEWEEGSFEFVKGEILEFFNQENLKNFGEVIFVPVSAMTG
jgi:translation elongation factor EF-1alpha